MHANGRRYRRNCVTRESLQTSASQMFANLLIIVGKTERLTVNQYQKMIAAHVDRLSCFYFFVCRL